MTTYIVHSTHRSGSTPHITFTQEDTIVVHYLYCYALVAWAIVAKKWFETCVGRQ